MAAACATAWRRDGRLRLGLLALLALTLLALLGPPLAALCAGPAYRPDVQNLPLGAVPPCWRHPLGTDDFGRDLAVRTLVGLRVSLGVGLCAGAMAACIGTLYGAIAGFLGGRTDALMMRAVDVMLALPYMFLVIILVTLMGRSMVLLFVTLALVGWLMMARIVRAAVLSLRERDFILALVGMGIGPGRIIVRHLIPNAVGPILVAFTLSVPALILEEAFLSFLGLGVQAPHPSLGSLVSDGAQTLLVFWWPLAVPAATLTLLLLALTLVGDGVRDALDPRRGAPGSAPEGGA